MYLCKICQGELSNIWDGIAFECSHCFQYGVYFTLSSAAHAILDDTITYQEMNLYFDSSNKVICLRHSNGPRADYKTIEEFPYDGFLTSQQAIEWLNKLKQYQCKIDKMRAFL